MTYLKTASLSSHNYSWAICCNSFQSKKSRSAILSIPRPEPFSLHTVVIYLSFRILEFSLIQIKYNSRIAQEGRLRIFDIFMLYELLYIDRLG